MGLIRKLILVCLTIFCATAAADTIRYDFSGTYNGTSSYHGYQVTFTLLTDGYLTTGGTFGPSDWLTCTVTNGTCSSIGITAGGRSFLFFQGVTDTGTPFDLLFLQGGNPYITDGVHNTGILGGTVTVTSAPTPEPATMGLLALGLAGIGAMRKRLR